MGGRPGISLPHLKCSAVRFRPRPHPGARVAPKPLEVTGAGRLRTQEEAPPLDAHPIPELLAEASESDSGTFQVWEGEAGPPSHSIPPHRVAKAAATLGEEAFERVHDRLLRAYFTENRDITSDATLAEIWKEAELPSAQLERAEEPAVLEQILREYREAFEVGATGVPSVRRADQEVAVTGAFPVEFYRRWVERALNEVEPGAAS